MGRFGVEKLDSLSIDRAGLQIVGDLLRFKGISALTLSAASAAKTIKDPFFYLRNLR
jgi:hypothetical protein